MRTYKVNRFIAFLMAMIMVIGGIPAVPVLASSDVTAVYEDDILADINDGLTPTQVGTELPEDILELIDSEPTINEDGDSVYELTDGSEYVQFESLLPVQMSMSEPLSEPLNEPLNGPLARTVHTSLDGKITVLYSITAKEHIHAGYTTIFYTGYRTNLPADFMIENTAADYGALPGLDGVVRVFNTYEHSEVVEVSSVDDDFYGAVLYSGNLLATTTSKYIKYGGTASTRLQDRPSYGGTNTNIIPADYVVVAYYDGATDATPTATTKNLTWYTNTAKPTAGSFIETANDPTGGSLSYSFYTEPEWGKVGQTQTVYLLVSSSKGISIVTTALLTILEPVNNAPTVSIQSISPINKSLWTGDQVTVTGSVNDIDNNDVVTLYYRESSASSWKAVSPTVTPNGVNKSWSITFNVSDVSVLWPQFAVKAVDSKGAWSNEAYTEYFLGSQAPYVNSATLSKTTFVQYNDNLTINGLYGDNDLADIVKLYYRVDGGAQVYTGINFTTSGTKFSENYSFTYKVPTTLTYGSHTISVYAQDKRGINSVAQRVTFTIEDVPDEQTGEVKSDVKVSFAEFPRVDVVMAKGKTSTSYAPDVKAKLESMLGSQVTTDYKVTTVETSQQDIDNLNSFVWKKDVNSSIGSIATTGNTVTMKGNPSLAGKNAVWTVDDNIYTSQKLSFNYSLNFGDSFNGAAFLFNVKDRGSYLDAYAITLHNTRGTWRGEGSAALRRFTYTKGSNTSNINAPAVAQLNVPTNGSITLEIGADFVIVNGQRYTIAETGGSGIGFLADHYSHGCSSIGEFKLTNISMSRVVEKSKALIEVLREANWRDNTLRFLINLEDIDNVSIDTTEKRAEVLTRFVADDINFISWGTATNKSTMTALVNSLTSVRGETSGIVRTDNNSLNNVAQPTIDFIKTKITTVPKSVLLLNNNYKINVTPSTYMTSTADSLNYPLGKWFINQSSEGWSNWLGYNAWSQHYENPFPVTFDRVGDYSITFEDKITDISSFKVHRPPIADFAVTTNASKIATLKDASYDPDKQTVAGRGIKAYKWMKSTDGLSWTTLSSSQTAPTIDVKTGINFVSLMVQDYDGEWSVPCIKTITTSVNLKPIANFRALPAQITIYGGTDVTDLSYDPMGRVINGWQYDLYNSDGTVLIKSKIHSSTSSGDFRLNWNTSWGGTGSYVIKLQVTVGAKTGTYEISESYAYVLQVVPDTTPPVIVAAKGSGEWTNTSLNDKFTAEDDESGIQKTWFSYDSNKNNVSPSDSSNPSTDAVRNVTLSAESPKSGWFVHVKAQNRAGLTSTKTFGPYLVDKTSPTVNYKVSPAGWTHKPISIIIEATDALSGISRIERVGVSTPISIGSDTGIDSTITANGTYVYAVYDVAGNCTTISVPITNYYTTPSVPRNVSTKNLNNGSFELTWDVPEVGEISYYKIYDRMNNVVATVEEPIHNKTLSDSNLRRGYISSVAVNNQESVLFPISVLDLDNPRLYNGNPSAPVTALSWDVDVSFDGTQSYSGLRVGRSMPSGMVDMATESLVIGAMAEGTPPVVELTPPTKPTGAVLPLYDDGIYVRALPTDELALELNTLMLFEDEVEDGAYEQSFEAVTEDEQGDNILGVQTLGSETQSLALRDMLRGGFPLEDPPYPADMSPTLVDDTIIVQDGFENTMNISWVAAQDDYTVPEYLLYHIFYQDSPFEESALDQLLASAAVYDTISGSEGIFDYQMTNLDMDEEYYILIIVQDESGNETSYRVATGWTIFVDYNPPYISKKKIEVTDVSEDSVALEWTKAIDATTAQENLLYYVYQSKNPINGSSTEALNDKPGVSLLTPGGINNNYHEAIGLSATTKYYFVVIVQDEAGNESKYDQVSAETLASGSAITITANPPSGAWTVGNFSIQIDMETKRGFMGMGGNLKNSSYVIDTSPNAPAEITSNKINHDSRSASRTVNINDEGVYYVHVYVTNTRDNSRTQTFGPYRIDRTPPTATAEHGSSEAWVDAFMETITLSDNGASGVKEYTYWLETINADYEEMPLDTIASMVPYTGPIKINLPTSGTSYIYLVSRDKVNNISEIEVYGPYNINADLSVDVASGGCDWYHGDFDEAIIVDTTYMGLTKLWYTIDQSSVAPTGITLNETEETIIPIKIIDEGINYLHVRALGANGKERTVTFGPYKINKRPAKISQLPGYTTDWLESYTEKITVEEFAPHTVSKTYYELSNLSYATGDVTTNESSNDNFTINLNQNGVWYIHVKAVNETGLATYATFGPYNIASSGPVITANLGEGGWTSSELSDTFRAEDVVAGVKETYYVVSTNSTPPSQTFDDNASTDVMRILTINGNGVWYVHMRALSYSGKYSVRTFGPYRIDKEAPNVTVTKTPTTQGVESVSVKLVSTDSGSGVYRVEGGNIESHDANGDLIAQATPDNITDTITKNGTYTYRIYDKVGNITVVNVIIDNIRPNTNKTWKYNIHAKADIDLEYTVHKNGLADTLTEIGSLTDRAGAYAATFTKFEVDVRKPHAIIYFTEPKDKGTEWDILIEGLATEDEAKLISNSEKLYIESGVKGYSIVYDQSAYTIPDNSIETTSTNWKFTSNINNGGWVHIAAIDYMGNIGAVLHKYYDPAIYNNAIDLKIEPVLDPPHNNPFYPHQPQAPFTTRINTRWTNSDATTWEYTLYRSELVNGVLGAYQEMTIQNGLAYADMTSLDKAPPSATGDPTITKIHSHREQDIAIDFVEAVDYGTTYEYYLKAIRANDGTVNYSYDRRGEVKSGIAGYSIVIDKSPNTIPDNTLETLTNSYTIENLWGQDYWIHIKPLDFAGNAGPATHFHFQFEVDIDPDDITTPGEDPDPEAGVEPGDGPNVEPPPTIVPIPEHPEVDPENPDGGGGDGEWGEIDVIPGNPGGGIKPPLEVEPDYDTPLDPDGNELEELPDLDWENKIFLDPAMFSSTFYEEDEYDKLGFGIIDGIDRMGTPDWDGMLEATNTWGLPMTYKWLLEGKNVSTRLKWDTMGMLPEYVSYDVRVPFVYPETVTTQDWVNGAHKLTVDVTVVTPADQELTSATETFSYKYPFHLFKIPKLEQSVQFVYNNFDIYASWEHYESTGTMPTDLDGNLATDADDFVPKVGEQVTVIVTTNKYVENLYMTWWDQDAEQPDGTFGGMWGRNFVEDSSYAGVGKIWRATLPVPDTLDYREYSMDYDPTDSHYTDGLYDGLVDFQLRIMAETSWGSKYPWVPRDGSVAIGEEQGYLTRFKEAEYIIKMQPIKLFNLHITDITDHAVDFQPDNSWQMERFGRSGVYVRNLPVDNALITKGYGFYFELSSKGLKKDIDHVVIEPRFFATNADGTGIGDELTGYIKNNEQDYVDFTTVYSYDFNEPSNPDSADLYYDRYKYNHIGNHARLDIGIDMRVMDGSTQYWNGRYGIPSNAQFFRMGDEPNSEDAYEGYILIVFDIRAFRAEKDKYQYVLKRQWWRERERMQDVNADKQPFLDQEEVWRLAGENIGAVAIYDSQRRVVDDYYVKPVWNNGTK